MFITSRIFVWGFHSETSSFIYYRYGNVVNNSLLLVNASCDTFLSSRITYRNTALTSPKTDYLQGHVIITNTSNGLAVNHEWFTVRVNIEAGITNQPPVFR